MLKIREHDLNGNKIDLKELEKFGFQKGYNLFFSDDTPVIIVAIVDEERNLRIQYSDLAWLSDNYWYLYSYSQDFIYDLMKAGLIEKTSDDNE
jgi:hypothetical protein